ncbi:MAG: NusG domain II-containing protein [Lachnospiraceae bacterium]|nr:NusG domain II-containing protein [Lachnospiraceae bacterium]
MGKSITRNDLLLIAGILAAAIISFIFYINIRSTGTVVVVRVDGEISASYPLSVNRKVTIEGVGGRNVLEISGGEAKVTEADCPDKLCVHHTSISYDGQSIVCLPHRVTVTVEDHEPGVDDEMPDAVDAVAS